MKTIVLDKSALQAIPARLLSTVNQSFDLYLTDVLLVEICTDRQEGGRDKWMRKVLGNCDDLWVPPCLDIIIEEMTTGIPAYLFLTAEGIRHPLNAVYEHASPEEIKRHEAGLIEMSQIKCHPGDRDRLSELQQLPSDKTFYAYLSAHLSKYAGTATGKIDWTTEALPPAVEASPSFRPRPGWFSYSIDLVAEASLIWKLKKYGDSPAGEAKKPENFGADLFYIAYVGVANGLLACDRKMLDLAWACWPEKRENIYTYDQERKELAGYKPRWCRA